MSFLENEMRGEPANWEYSVLWDFSCAARVENAQYAVIAATRTITDRATTMPPLACGFPEERCLDDGVGRDVMSVHAGEQFEAPVVVVLVIELYGELPAREFPDVGGEVVALPDKCVVELHGLRLRVEDPCGERRLAYFAVVHRQDPEYVVGVDVVERARGEACLFGVCYLFPVFVCV